VLVSKDMQIERRERAGAFGYLQLNTRQLSVQLTMLSRPRKMRAHDYAAYIRSLRKGRTFSLTMTLQRYFLITLLKLY